jgi:outer membrane receptor for ferrienterochelin and colicin
MMITMKTSTQPIIKEQKLYRALFLNTRIRLQQSLTLVAGIREDHNSLFGWFTTPRLNVRYQPFTNTTIRLSAGRGQRTA